MGHKFIDIAWKDILIQASDDAIAFFKPDLAADRDTSKPVDFLKDELPVIGSDTDEGMRISDVCFFVPLKTGESQRVAFYIEQQHWSHKDFARRMYEGYYRTSDRLQVPVTSLAIFTGNVKVVDNYTVECYGTILSFKYNVYHVASADIEALRKDERVFAPVVLTAALMLKAGRDPKDRERYARELLMLMRERDYDRKKKRMILDFVGRIFQVQAGDMNPGFKEEWKMQLIPVEEAAKEVWVRHAKEEGIEEGRQEGEHRKALSTARNMLEIGIELEKIAQVTGLSLEEVKSLQK